MPICGIHKTNEPAATIAACYRNRYASASSAPEYVGDRPSPSTWAPRPRVAGNMIGSNDVIVRRPRVGTVDRPTVPAGWYAIGPADASEFYRVDRPTQGRWKGYVFVKRLSGPDAYPIKTKRGRAEVLDAIGAAGVIASMERYGREIGKCGDCNRRLTDAESRRIGRGPVCRGK